MSQHPFRTVLVAAATLTVIGIVGLAAFQLAAHRSPTSPTRVARGNTASAPVRALASPSTTPAATPTASPTAAPTTGSGKTGPATPPATAAGKYPYPLDAGGSVVTGTLSLSPAQVPAGEAATVTVSAGQGGWLAGQEIFVYLGQLYELTIAAPGGSGRLTVPAGTVGPDGVVVSGFQFPNNDPEAPIAGYGTATLRVG